MTISGQLIDASLEASVSSRQEVRPSFKDRRHRRARCAPGGSFRPSSSHPVIRGVERIGNLRSGDPWDHRHGGRLEPFSPSPWLGDARGCTPSCPAGRVHDTPARRQQTGAPGQLRRQRDISGVASTLGRNPYGSCIHESAGAGSRRRPMAATSQSPQVHFLFS